MSGLVGSPLFLATSAAAGGYEISRSLRFNSSDSAYLSRTPASAGNRKTWTWAGWVKRSKLGTLQQVLHTFPSAGNVSAIAFESGDTLSFYHAQSGQSDRLVSTTAVFRDASAWYHIVFAVDTTQSTNADRIKIYVNGTRITQFNSYSDFSGVDTNINSAVLHRIGSNAGSAIQLVDGYLSDVHLVDGQALDPTSFTEVSATTGQLVPKAYTGSFGTNGFWLKFSDNSAATATTLGKDYSGNSNNWSPTNLSVTAGAGNDSLVDTPTSYGTDDGLGGSVRGNYCTWNPLLKAGGDQTYTNGNLDVNTGSLGAGRVVGTIGVSSGKWYWEVVKTAGSGGQLVGVVATSENLLSEPGSTANGYSYYSSGQKYTNATLSAYGASWTTNDVIGIALDLDVGTLVFYKNGISQGTAFTGISGTFVPACSDDNSGSSNSTTAVGNFGQRQWAYAAPAGFKALCTTNLPAPVVAKPSTVMDVKLYTGNGGNQTVSGLEFAPDLVWIKGRSFAAGHILNNSVVGVGSGKSLYSNTTSSQGAFDQYGYLSALTSDGFTTQGGTDPTDPYNLVSKSGQTYVAWAWDAGSSTVTNTQGSITSSVRANASAGFSIVTYTGNLTAGATVGHGLGAIPSLVIIKERSQNTGGWITYHSSIGATGALYLNSTTVVITGNFYNNTAPTSTVFSLGANGEVNDSGQTNVAYCFAPVAGYSNGFSYTGNGSTDGSFVYLGFRPRLILLKCSSTTGNWTLLDTAREGYNVDNDPLYPNLSNAEGTTDLLDITSNGFKLRTTDASVNSSGATYVGYAWAEAPFAYSRAR